MSKLETATEVKKSSHAEQKQFSSKDFHQTFARPTYVKPSHVIHKNVENASQL
ncbi:hypothetical protein [Sphingobacterium arenae]|uniref:hypothetical protein n=1 Tax=Sphingobacterium arenae TaxID=1280598 RepID=UPI001CC1DD9A|nr:hypothetical protein [Sphingobacterium arenae]